MSLPPSPFSYFFQCGGANKVATVNYETRLDSRFKSKPICRAFLVLGLLQLAFFTLGLRLQVSHPVSPPSGVFPLLSAMAELEEEETVAAAPEPEEEVTDLNGAVRGVLLG